MILRSRELDYRVRWERLNFCGNSRGNPQLDRPILNDTDAKFNQSREPYLWGNSYSIILREARRYSHNALGERGATSLDPIDLSKIGSA